MPRRRPSDIDAATIGGGSFLTPSLSQVDWADPTTGMPRTSDSQANSTSYTSGTGAMLSSANHSINTFTANTRESSSYFRSYSYADSFMQRRYTTEGSQKILIAPPEIFGITPFTTKFPPLPTHLKNLFSSGNQPAIADPYQGSYLAYGCIPKRELSQEEWMECSLYGVWEPTTIVSSGWALVMRWMTLSEAKNHFGSQVVRVVNKKEEFCHLAFYSDAAQIKANSPNYYIVFDLLDA